MIVVLVLVLAAFAASHSDVDACELRDGARAQAWAECQEKVTLERLRHD